MKLSERLVRYRDLRPCRTAFIDTRSPGSDKKENFTIIGPGVAENPDQHVHIELPHGFNIGGARQPPHCLNSQHSHLTSEVFVVHSGSWAFRSGVDATDGEVILNPGDVISLPTDVFRGFENIGQSSGFLYAVLGNDDPGRVLWAPWVFDLARDHGLMLMEDGSLQDTQLNGPPSEGLSSMPRTTAKQVAQHRVIDSEGLRDIIVRSHKFRWSTQTTLSRFEGVEEVSLLGPANEAESMPAGHLGWQHGFVVRALSLAPGASIPAHIRKEEEVLFIQQGSCRITVDGESLEMNPGDSFTTPIGSRRSFSNHGQMACTLYITRRNNQPMAPEFT
jgi:mannose-6-phosphate isomerase-like protein (cupin superfamily)